MTKECMIAPSGYVISPKGILSYADGLYTAKNNGFGKLKHNLNILLPKDVDLTILKKEMAKLALEKLNGDKEAAMKMVNKRFLDPNDLPSGGKPAGPQFEGWTLIRATSDNCPRFVHPDGKRVEDSDLPKEVYSGRWGRVTLNPFWSDNKTNKGVFLGLQDVQVLDHGEPLGRVRPDSEGEFGAVDVAGAAAPNTSTTAPTGGTDVDSMFG